MALDKMHKDLEQTIQHDGGKPERTLKRSKGKIEQLTMCEPFPYITKASQAILLWPAH